MSETPAFTSGLLNAIDALVSFWAAELDGVLADNAEPPAIFWERLQIDLATAIQLATKVRNA